MTRFYCGKTREQVEDQVRKTVAEYLGYETSLVTDDKGIVADLGADSLDRLELCMAIEDEFDLESTDEEAEACRTVCDVVELVLRRTEVKS